MPTTKQRINICVPPYLNTALKKLSRKENVPVATKALELLKNALEMEEDKIFNHIAAGRDTQTAKYITHDELWG